jgi:hypothetical protein
VGHSLYEAPGPVCPRTILAAERPLRDCSCGEEALAAAPSKVGDFLRVARARRPAKSPRGID